MLTRNGNGSLYCTDCQCIVILFDDDVPECENDTGAAKWARIEAAERRDYPTPRFRNCSEATS